MHLLHITFQIAANIFQNQLTPINNEYFTHQGKENKMKEE